MLGTAKAGILKPVAGRNIPGLLAAYGFKEGAGTTTADVTGNGNTGTLDANCGWVSGKWGTGGVTIVSGTSSAITFPFGASMSPPYNGVSWCVWVKFPTTGVGDYSGIFGRIRSTGSSTRSGMAVMSSGAAWYVARWRDDLHTSSYGTTGHDGNWHHFAMVDGDTSWASYMDGIQQASGTRSDPPTLNTVWESFPWALGYSVNDLYSVPGTEYSDLRVFQGELSTAQVNMYMNTPV